MTWTNPPQNIALKILQESESHLKKVTTEMLQGVITASPVMDGTFRGNHRVSIDNEDKTADQSVNDLSGTQTLAEGTKEILKAKLGNVVYLQNNLPYAVRLENGHSKQAPLGIYSLTFQRVASKYK